MRLMSTLALGLVALTGTQPALAAVPDVPPGFVDERETFIPHVGFNLGGALALPISDVGDRFQTGGGFQFGVTYHFTRYLGLQAEYLYSGYNVQDDVLASQGVNGNHSMQYGNLNAVFNVLPARPIGVYVLGGPGIYHRRVQITEFAGVGFVPYCDPWLFFCYAEPVAIEEVLRERSRMDFGLNAGAGVSLRLFGGPLRLYLEGRYHYIFGGTIDVLGGNRRANGQYLPIVFGVRL